MADVPDIKAEMTSVVAGILTAINRPRETSVVERRYGLTGEKETLEQIGETMNITRERVRQIEKSTMLQAKISLENGKNSNFNSIEMDITKALHEMGRGARVEDLTRKLIGDDSVESKALVTILAELSSKMVVTSENDRYYAAIVLSTDKSDSAIKEKVDEIVATIKQHGQPLTLDELYRLVGSKYEHPTEVAAIASISKKLAELHDTWGLVKWPQVNPRNIRDKIYVVLKHSEKPMHFSAIAEAVKAQNFKRNNVTEQAIHNELIKDPRFVLIGRGIYALAECGYKRGSITDVITDLLRQNGAMDREEIVRDVLKVRQVREATILLNLQSKPQFKRIARSRYELDENAIAAKSATATRQ